MYSTDLTEFSAFVAVMGVEDKSDIRNAVDQGTCVWKPKMVSL